MANPDKIRSIKSYNPHCFTGGDTPAPATIDLWVRSEAGAPVAATAVPVTKQVDERTLLINLKDFDFESSDIIAIVDVCTPCPVYSDEIIFSPPPEGAPGVIDTVNPPTVTVVAPVSGDNDGAVPITLTGTNFVDGATVTVGATSATSVVFVSPTSITAVVPIGATPLGVVNVVVTNPDGQTGTKVGGYTIID